MGYIQSSNLLKSIACAKIKLFEIYLCTQNQLGNETVYEMKNYEI